MSAIFFTVLGILIGVIGITIFAYFISKKDNQKFDASNQDLSITFKSDIWEDKNIPGAWKSTTSYSPQGFGKKLKAASKKPKSKKTLEEQLTDSLEIEDYENAAKLRDKINKLKTK